MHSFSWDTPFVHYRQKGQNRQARQQKQKG
jgi:hypothetical protein